MSAGPDYGRLDRLLHRVAFRMQFAQEALSDLEDSFLRSEFDALDIRHPVFICGLPRSGSTALLHLLVATGRFASHSYRDLPFLLCPVLWNRFAARFFVDEPPRERVHGDGLRISRDSPVALEEVLWKRFWPEHYEDDQIVPWAPNERNPEFEGFIRGHMKKLLLVRGASTELPLRYVSKNNGHIARLSARPRPLEDGTILVLVREPTQQAASLLLQHQRFLDLQRRDPFVLEYMNALGHHEFGYGLKPVAFDDWFSHAPAPEDLEFWLRYWIATYTRVEESLRPGMHVVSYARLTHDPETELSTISEILNAPRAELCALAHMLRPPREHLVNVESLDPTLFGRARDLQRRLEESGGSLQR